MDKKHNIRNMSVIAHVDHVSTRVREPAPFPGRHPRRDREQSEWGLGGSFSRGALTGQGSGGGARVDPRALRSR